MRPNLRKTPREKPAETKEIQAFIHCTKCLRELPVGLSPRENAMLEIGLLPDGVTVRCVRHDTHVVTISVFDNWLDLIGQDLGEGDGVPRPPAPTIPS